MRLFIQVNDGQPVGHPITEDNMRYAFPNVDLNKLPSNFSLFERVIKPRIGAYEVYEGVEYGLVDGVYKDVHKVRPMTDGEKQIVINEARSNPPYASWIFNEEECRYYPPTPKPDDGKRYRWNEDTTTWDIIE